MYFTENMTGPRMVSTIYEGGAAVGLRIQVKNPTLGMSLSRLEDFSVQVDRTCYPASEITFILRGIRYSFAQMQTIATVRWEFGETAELLVPRPGGLGAIGNRDMEVAIGFRMGFENVQWRRKRFMVSAIGEDREGGKRV